MTNPIHDNKLLIFRLLEQIGDNVRTGNKAAVEHDRVQLSLISQLEIERPDELTKAVRQVFDLTGRWERLGDGTPEEISLAVDDAIRLLNKPEYGSRPKDTAS